VPTVPRAGVRSTITRCFDARRKPEALGICTADAGSEGNTRAWRSPIGSWASAPSPFATSRTTGADSIPPRPNFKRNKIRLPRRSRFDSCRDSTPPGRPPDQKQEEARCPSSRQLAAPPATRVVRGSRAPFHARAGICCSCPNESFADGIAPRFEATKSFHVLTGASCREKGGNDGLRIRDELAASAMTFFEDILIEVS